MDKIAKPCCGSCERWDDCGGEGTFCDHDIIEWPKIYDYCNEVDYSPHNPLNPESGHHLTDQLVGRR